MAAIEPPTGKAASAATERAEIRRGDLYWIQLDEPTANAPSVAHPHLVIQDDLFNRSRIHTVVVCALTSRLSWVTEPGNVMLDPGEADLEKQSVVVVSQVSSVEKARLGSYIGRLDDARVERVLAGMRFQQRSGFG
jgi:mRNA interferase MazF